ncbi:hypothetical protein RRG08_014603 [Elysia crispata]|uniref:Uncharacterized protein n=1 Tax=Elysia crispata TaxID=231223 RepID=A0AAE1D3E4_9GAST|nr:hypothetical protein RRG08_014603 [Elysia crispata]
MSSLSSFYQIVYHLDIQLSAAVCAPDSLPLGYPVIGRDQCYRPRSVVQIVYHLDIQLSAAVSGPDSLPLGYPVIGRVVQIVYDLDIQLSAAVSGPDSLRLGYLVIGHVRHLANSVPARPPDGGLWRIVSRILLEHPVSYPNQEKLKYGAAQMRFRPGQS